MKKIFAFLLTLTVLALSAVCVSAETPPLPENNKLLNDVWVKNLGNAKVSEETVDGVKVTTMSRIDSSYSSAALDIMPTVEALMGDDDEIDLWIVLDVRIDAEDGEEFPFGMKIRAGGTTSLVSTEEAFAENYTDATTFRHRGSGGISITVLNDGTFTNQWQRIEIYQNFTAFDLNRDFWKEWNLCFDMMAEYESMGDVQIRNVGVFLYDEYEPVEVEDDDEDEKTEEYITPVTPSPAIINKPYYFDKYNSTFNTVKDSATPEADNATPNADNAGGTVTDGQVNGDNTKTVIIIVACVVLVAAIVAAVILISKKRKNNNGGKEE